MVATEDSFNTPLQYFQSLYVPLQSVFNKYKCLLLHTTSICHQWYSRTVIKFAYTVFLGNLTNWMFDWAMANNLKSCFLIPICLGT